jgi:hypothetical protein
MPTPTINYSFNLPVEGADDDVWGGLLNANWTALDTLLFSGTIGAATTGNAATATLATLATLATDATTLATPRDFTIGATTRSFDGSANVTWSLTDIGIVLADKATAEAGINNTEFMTPLRTNEAIAALAPAPAQLTQGQAEDPASTVFGTVSGQRLAQAVAEFAPSSAASASADSVGSYAFLANLSSTDTAPGNTVAGSALRFFGIRDTQVSSAGNIYGSAPSGTWRCMGTGNANSGTNTAGTVWLRIS